MSGLNSLRNVGRLLRSDPKTTTGRAPIGGPRPFCISAPKPPLVLPACCVAATCAAPAAGPHPAPPHRRQSPTMAPTAPSKARGVATAAAPAPTTHLLDDAPTYRTPHADVLAVVDAPPEPGLSFSPDRTRVLQMHRPPPLPPVADLARPELRLAGLRIDPALNARSRMGHYERLAIAAFTGDTVLPVRDGGGETPVTGYPPGHLINYVTWSKSGTSIAFTTRPPQPPGGVEGATPIPSPTPLHLWVADAATGCARRLLGGGTGGVDGLNAVFEDYAWIDDATLVAAVIPPGRGGPPSRPPAPAGPKIQCNVSGATSQGRTYQDLLADPDDEAAFEYYGASLLARVCVASGTVTLLHPGGGGEAPGGGVGSATAAASTPPPPRLYCAAAPSPDGAWLAVSWLERPFSYAFPCGRFPRVTQLWRMEGDGAGVSADAVDLARLPLATSIPIAMDSVREGPRGLAWRPDAPASLSWLEAQDGGDPGAEPVGGPGGARDILFTATAADMAAGVAPVALATTEWRCGGVAWGGPDLALLYESRYKTRMSRVWTFSPGAGEAADATKVVLHERCFEDAYGDPGSPALVRCAPHGTYVLARPGGGRTLLMQGAGASPEGNRPFVDVLDVDTKQTKRIWQSSPPFHETAGSLLTTDTEGGVVPLDGMQILTTREAEEDPPQTHVLAFHGDLAAPAWADRTLTDFPHPHPTLRGATKKILRYKREDGVELTATLHTPPGWVAGRDPPLPTFVWTYPREFKNAAAAGQMRRSHHEFASISPHGPLTLLARGYAVLDGPTIPIVATGGREEDEPNDAYVEQLVAGARAAVEAAVAAGATDRARVAIGGHSYGAFTAANLLARAPGLFCCGVARSGAYNRTLTPMGFQAEERTLWQVPAVYEAMSAFHVADKVSAPLLLIHGDADSNPGTHTLQSERMYSALKGHGIPARLVLLPHEGHGYRGRESVLHVLAETEAWLDKWCKKEEEEGGE